MTDRKNGKAIPCANCGGEGLIHVGWPYPEECPDCDGSGKNWRYDNGTLARYYSGPLIGKDTITFGSLAGGKTKGPRNALKDAESLRSALKNAAKTARRRSDRADEEAYEAAIEDAEDGGRDYDILFGPGSE